MERPLDRVLSLLSKVRRAKEGQYSALCPAHSDHQPSLSVSEGDGGEVLLTCHAGCDIYSIVEAMGLKLRDLFPNGSQPKRKRRVVATYDYRDTRGKLLRQVVRYEPKRFRQRRPNGAGGWAWNTKGVPEVPYRLPELVAADPKELVFIVEGEKSANAVAALGLVATTNSGGAEKWHVGGENHTKPLSGRSVVILPDNDDPGRRHAQQVAQSLYGIASSVRTVELPGLEHKQDVVDWLGNGGDAEKLRELAESAPEWEPSTADDDTGGPQGNDRANSTQGMDDTVAGNPSNDADQRRRWPIGARLSKKATESIMAIVPNSPDPEMRQRIIAALLERTQDGKKLLPALLRRQKAGRLLLAWLSENGGFVQSKGGEQFYFHHRERRLYRLESNHWRAWLYSLTGANPAGTDYAHLAADCQTMAIDAPRQRIVRVSAWDDESQLLRVSRFDGTVYVLNGEKITEEANGEKVLFYDDSLWEPYSPDLSGSGVVLHRFTTELPNWKGCTIRAKDSLDSQSEMTQLRKMNGLALRVWQLSTFFTELCPTRPFLGMVGEKGSGKTMTLRIFLRSLFGPLAEVRGVPDKPDGFTAASAAAHILVLDNLDGFRGWLRDKLARLSTGGIDEYRRLYTSNEVGRVYYRCWLAFTSRAPDTLRRDDLADRLLLLQVERIDHGESQSERSFQKEADLSRDRWWGDVLNVLNQVVSAIRQGKLEQRATLRMADWETLGRVIAQVENATEDWARFVRHLSGAQADFLLEGDLIVEGLNLWMRESTNHGRDVTARELFSELTGRLFGEKRPPTDWPKSSIGFGKRLAGIRRELKTYYQVEWWDGTTAEHRGRLVYCFQPKAENTGIQRYRDSEGNLAYSQTETDKKEIILKERAKQPSIPEPLNHDGREVLNL